MVVIEDQHADRQRTQDALDIPMQHFFLLARGDQRLLALLERRDVGKGADDIGSPIRRDDAVDARDDGIDVAALARHLALELHRNAIPERKQVFLVDRLSTFRPEHLVFGHSQIFGAGAAAECLVIFVGIDQAMLVVAYEDGNRQIFQHGAQRVEFADAVTPGRIAGGRRTRALAMGGVDNQRAAVRGEDADRMIEPFQCLTHLDKIGG